MAYVVRVASCVRRLMCQQNEKLMYVARCIVAVFLSLVYCLQQ